jgi:putative transposase
MMRGHIRQTMSEMATSKKSGLTFRSESVGTEKIADRKKKRRKSSKEKGSGEMTNQLARKPYPSDVTDAQWEILAPFIPEPAADSPREPILRRELVNGIFYLLRTGCSWRQMPHDLPNGKTVYYYFRRWKLDGTWERAMTALRKQVRTQMGRDPEPSAAIIDSQSIKTAPVRSIERGYDAGKKNPGSQTAHPG